MAVNNPYEINEVQPTTVSKLAKDVPTLFTGFTGNYYVICTDKDPLIRVCLLIDKAPKSIYWSEKHQCFAIRIKRRSDKEKVKYQAGREIGLTYFVRGNQAHNYGSTELLQLDE